MRALVLLFPFLILPVASGAVEWRPIEPSELTQKTPHVDPAADAEAIFWDIRVEDHLMGADLSIELHHYIRIKIFTERGKEKYATIEIPVVGKQYVTNVAARTIKPDGTAIELKKDSIFDRELLKSRNLKMRGKSFSMPNVEVGDNRAVHAPADAARVADVVRHVSHQAAERSLPAVRDAQHGDQPQASAHRERAERVRQTVHEQCGGV
jgi:Domain of Unknown Function with PDB structure (DUF3857)